MTKSRTVAALASLMEGFAVGICPNIEIELMSFLVDIFACDGVDAPTVQCSPEELAEVLRKLWGLTEANTRVRATVLEALLRGPRGAKLLCVTLRHCRNIDTLQGFLMGFARYWREKRSFGWDALVPAWYLTAQSPETESYMRLGGGLPHLISEHAAVVRACALRCRNTANG